MTVRIIALSSLVAFGLLVAGLWSQYSPQPRKHTDKVLNFADNSADDRLHLRWSCDEGVRARHDLQLRSDTTLESIESASDQLNNQEWFFTVWGQVEEVCVKPRLDEFGVQRWIVHYAWAAEGLEQNIQSADLDFQAAIHSSLRSGIFVERSDRQVFQIWQNETTHEVAYELWRMFLLGQLTCSQPVAAGEFECLQAWIDQSFTSQYSYQDGEQSWHQQGQLPRSPRHAQLIQSLDAVLVPSSRAARMEAVQLTLGSEQKTAFAIARDKTRVELSLQDYDHVSSQDLLALQARFQAASPLFQNEMISEAQGQRGIYERELTGIDKAELWQKVGNEQEQTDRYLQIKAWVYLNEDQISSLAERLKTLSFDDPLLGLWLKALAQAGHAAGQELLVDLLLERSDELDFGKYVLAALAFSEQPAASLDQKLKAMLQSQQLPKELQGNLLLTIGTWANRLSGERAEDLGGFILGRWDAVTELNDRLAVIQALGNSGYPGGKNNLLLLARQESDPRLAAEAVYALRFIEGSLSDILGFTSQDPQRQGALRAVRAIRLQAAELEQILAFAQQIEDWSQRYQLVVSLLQNPLATRLGLTHWEAFLEGEGDTRVRELIETSIDQRSLRGS